MSLANADEEYKKWFSSEVHDDGIKIIRMLNAQIRGVVYFKRISKRVMLSDRFVYLYAFGAWESVSTKWGLQIRNSMGPTLTKMGFIGYFRREFCTTEEIAQSLLNKAIEFSNIDATNPAIVAGGADGFEIFQGGAPMRLCAHYNLDLSGPLSSEESKAFLRYCQSQGNSPTL